MGKNMWHKIGAKGAPRGCEGERVWVSGKTESISFQPQPNNNKKIAENSRETYLVQMTTCTSCFADQENNKHFQPRMRLKETLNIKRITAAATQIDQKLTHKW